MTRILIALMLTLASTHAYTKGLPWQSSDDGEPLDYCKGFVAGALASNKVADTARVDLWLAWNYLIRSAPLGEGPDGKEFQAGLKEFQTAAADTAAQSVIQQSDGDCGLGRSGHQITGW